MAKKLKFENGSIVEIIEDEDDEDNDSEDEKLCLSEDLIPQYMNMT